MTSLLAQATDNAAPALFFGFGAFGIIIALLLGAFWLWMLIDALTNQALDSTMKIVWALVIFFFPFIGALVYLFIHQIEGHIIVPRLMGGAVKVHPLAVIFALLAGEELYGIAGVLVTLPLVAVGREIIVFLHERIGIATWKDSPW